MKLTIGSLFSGIAAVDVLLNDKERLDKFVEDSFSLFDSILVKSKFVDAVSGFCGDDPGEYYSLWNEHTGTNLDVALAALDVLLNDKERLDKFVEDSFSLFDSLVKSKFVDAVSGLKNVERNAREVKLAKLKKVKFSLQPRIDYKVFRK